MAPGEQAAEAPAQLVIPVYDLDEGSVGNQDFGGSLGMDFDVSEPLTPAFDRSDASSTASADLRPLRLKSALV